MISRTTFATVSSLILVALLSCTQSTDQAGGAGGETTNGIVVQAYYPDNRPASDAVVRLRKADYLADTITGIPRQPLDTITTRTDDSGYVVIDSLKAGAYRLEINDENAYAALLDCVLEPDGGHVNLGSTLMKPYATITGALPDTIVSSLAPRFVQVYGLERLIPVDSAGRYELTDLPEGTYQLRLVSGAIKTPPIDLDTVRVGSGDTVEAPGPRSQYFRTIALNTTSSGAWVAVDVYAFPLFIRIDSAQFDFGQFQGHGEDVRFVNSAGKRMPHEIEIWDSAGGYAAVWVKMDTVYGNSDSGYLSMLWGDRQAVSLSNSTTVFDTSDGYEGVWHLFSEDGAAIDATQNLNTGVPINNPAFRAISQSVCGAAFTFPDDSSYIDIGNNPSIDISGTTPLSISAWVNVDMLPSRDMVILSKGNHQFQLAYRWGDETFDFDIYTGTGWQKAVPAISIEAGTWYHVAGVYYPQLRKNVIYVNGIKLAENEVSAINSISSDPVHIAARYSSLNEVTQVMRGALDEIRLERTSRSADWIKLCYENQRPDQVFITFE